MTGAGFLGLCLPSLLSIVDPLAAIPLFVALVAKDPKPEQRRTLEEIEKSWVKHP